MRRVMITFWAMALIFIGCKTVELLEDEARLLKQGTIQEFDEVGAELVKETSRRIRREVGRARATISDKIRKEIYRTAYRWKLTKKKRYIDWKKAFAESGRMIAETKKTAAFKRIVNPSPDLDKAYYKTPHKWEPTLEDKTSFFERSPKMRQARKELQLVKMALWTLEGSDFLCYDVHRSKEKQLEYFNKGASKVKFSNHNYNPSRAADCIVLKQGKADWEDIEQILHNRGMEKILFCALARQYGWKNLKIRTGADFNQNNIVGDKEWKDYVHVEVVPGEDANCKKGII